MKISLSEFENKIHTVLDLPINLAWQGYGSAIFLELGTLQNFKGLRQNHQKGESCIQIEWDWRVEYKTKVLFGSSNQIPEIGNGIKKLIGTSIKKIELTGEVPELKIIFSNGMKLQSMVMVSGDPEWAIRIEDNYLYYKNENYIIANGDEPVEDLSYDDNEEITFSEETAKRWGCSFEDPILGNCTNCKFYIQLNASYSFLDYGIYSNKYSNFDKKVVNVKSGCPNFKKEN